MIIEKEGNALNSGADILAHQTNCIGAMGAGIAKQIKDQLLSKEDYNIYRSLCKNLGSDLLGTVQYIKVKPQKEELYKIPKIVANVFGENVPTKDQIDTNYEALKEGLQTVHDYALDNKYSVCVPGFMGCGLAGGDWNVVKGILEDIFKDSEVELTIMYFDGIPDLMKKIESWTNPKNSKFNSLSISIENIIINSGIGGKDFFSKDDFSNPYHGFVYSTTYMEESPSEARLSIITETRYPIMLIWESIVKTYLPGAELVFSISNIEKELFFTNDPEVCGTYFIPYSPYCLKNDCCTKEELLELLQDIENTDEDDLETLILYAPADFYFYKWKPLEEIEKENKKNKVCLEELNPGEVFKVGKYDFIVLDQDMRNHTTKVISKNFMTENVVFDNDTRDYSKSNLKKVIEENIQPLIEEEICLQMRT